MMRGQEVQDYQIRQNELQRQYGNLMGQVPIGLQATGQTAAADANAIAQQTQLRNTGAAATAAGNIGAEQAMIEQVHAQNRADQSGFNKLMSIVGLGVGGYAAYKG